MTGNSTFPKSGEPISSPDPRELFDRGLELFRRGDAQEAVAVLREAFFGNLFIAPVLLGITASESHLWVPGPSATHTAAKEYAKTKRKQWQSVPNALRFLRCLWNDPLVRREIRSYQNFCKSYARAQGSSKVRSDAALEGAKFTNKKRIRSTQKEIVARIRGFRLDLPPDRPELVSIAVTCKAPQKLVSFLQDVLGFSPTYMRAASASVFALPGVELRVQPGENESHSGVEIALKVTDFEFYTNRLEDKEIEPLAAQKELTRERFILLEAPGGLVLRLIEKRQD